jgi:hypothetical protein
MPQFKQGKNGSCHRMQFHQIAFFFWEEELNTDEGLGTRGNHARVYLALKRNDGISHL